MTANTHPSSRELLTVLGEPGQAASTLEHLNVCLACRVRLSRLRRAAGLAPATADSVQRIVQASTPLPGIPAELLSASHGREPQPNEIWRVGRSEALLVWVRRVFDDGVADVVPLVLDVELADQESVVISTDATPLATEIAALVALRTHVHVGAFLNRIGSLDIGRDVIEVMTAVREGRRPSGVRVGPPIDDDDDQRLEFRQALRDLLAELSPSAWVETQAAAGGVEHGTGESIGHHAVGDVNAVKTRLEERLWGVRFIDVASHTISVDSDVRVKSVLKVLYLDLTILVTTLHNGAQAAFPDPLDIAAACQRMTLAEPDVDAVAVAIPQDDWPTQLFTTAHMRTAFEIPGGARSGPTATLSGYGLVDTLCKHIEGAMPVWEVVERATNRVATADLHRVAAGHASRSIAQITVEGRRAQQAAKRASWGSLPDELVEKVARFVVAVTNNEATDAAFAELALEADDD